MLGPQPGWAEHRPPEDCWGAFACISRKLLAEKRVPPSARSARGRGALGPLMLPVEAAGEPLMNAILYGVDTRAAKEVAQLTETIGEEVLLDRCGNALTSQSVGPKILWLRRNRPEIFAQARKIVSSVSYLVHRLTGTYVIDHYTASSFSPLYRLDQCKSSDALCSDIVGLDRLPGLAWTTDIAGGGTGEAAEETEPAAAAQGIAAA